MDSLWTPYGLPMDSLWSTYGTTPSPHRSNTVVPPRLLAVPTLFPGFRRRISPPTAPCPLALVPGARTLEAVGRTGRPCPPVDGRWRARAVLLPAARDRKSTRLNS